MASKTKTYDDVDSLIKEYHSVYQGYQGIDNSQHPSSSSEYQELLADVIDKAEGLVKGVNDHSLMANNEGLDELPSEHLRFLLLPALLGYLHGKRTAVPTPGDKLAIKHDRRRHIIQARSYFHDFINLCKMYGVELALKYELAEDDGCDDDKTGKRKKLYEKDAMTRKSEKVQRYKAQKLLEKDLTDLFSKMSLDHVDDSIKRDYYLKLIDKWILTAQEELGYIEEELDILELAMGGEKPQPLRKTNTQMATRPFILTKNSLQRKVFGAGYPSLPTYTVEEFYDAQVKAGRFPAGGGMPSAEAEASEQQEIVKEFKVENDDEETLKKAREWDDWKDDHRRGWGNRKNMG